MTVPSLAMIVTDADCNVQLSSCEPSAAGTIQRFLSGGGTRLRPELESVVLQLIGERPDGSGAQSRVVGLDGGTNLCLSALASPDGIRYALILDRDRTHDRVVRAVTRFKLTRRQAEVLSLVLEGAGAAEIAAQLCISEYTAQGYLKSLLIKTSSRNRAAMVARVLEWERRAGMPAARSAEALA